jgi:sugar phosphate isomerase/epimerase
MCYLDKLSFQLYSSRNFPPLETQLATLAAIGYRQVEPYGGLYDDPGRLADALAHAGLTAPSGHVALAAVRDAPDRVAAIAQRIGMRYVVVPYLAADERPADSEGWRQIGATLNRLAEDYADRGLVLAWHNHDFEFAPLADGGVPMSLLLDAAPEVALELDLAWAVKGGVDPVEWLQRYRGRVIACHIKDIAVEDTDEEDGWADVGHGRLDWAVLAPAAVDAGAELLVVEHDAPSDFERCARRSYATVAGWEGRA